jgi:hypothetical protein
MITSNKVNILGTEYSINVLTDREDEALESSDGYTDPTVKLIVIRDNSEDKNNGHAMIDLESLMNKTARHEIIHAFLCESGLIRNSSSVNNWSTNEEMVDWFAIQFPKIHKVYEELGIL